MAGTNLANIGGVRPSDAQSNKKVDSRVKPATSLGSFSAGPRVNLKADFKGSGKALQDVGGLITKEGQDVLARENARAAAQLEVNQQMEDRSNNKISLQLRRDYALETNKIVESFASQDMSDPKVIADYNKKVGDSLYSYQDKFKQDGGTDRGFDAYNEHIFSQSNTIQDQGIIRQRDDELKAIKSFRTEGFNNLNNPEKIDKNFGANPMGLIPSLLSESQRLADDVNVGLSPDEQLITDRLALSTVQNLAFDFYMRRQDFKSMESLFVDTRFDRINGFDGEIALRDRWQKAKISKRVDVYNEKTDKIENIAESERRSHHIDPKHVTSEMNLKGLRNDIKANSSLDPKDQLPIGVLYANRKIEVPDHKLSALMQQYADNKILANELGDGDAEKTARILDSMNDQTTKNSIPVSHEIEAFRKGVDKANETAGEAQGAADITADPDASDAQKDAFKPDETALAAIQGENRRTLMASMGGKPNSKGDLVLNDPVKLEIFNAVLPMSAKLLRTTNLTAAEAQAQAFEEYAKETGIDNPQSANMYSTIAKSVVDERKARQVSGGNIRELKPMASHTSGGETRESLQNELQDLKEATKGRIDAGKASGLISGLEQLWANIPGQFFESTVDEETLDARLALLRVSREVMTLVMKNDRFAIAEQIIITPLLERPGLLTSGSAINAQLRRYKKELEIGIVEAQTRIDQGFKRDENLEKVVDYTRIASMLDQFVLAPPLIQTPADDILKINDKETFRKLEGRMKPNDWDRMSRDQREAMKTMQDRMDIEGGFSDGSAVQEEAERKVEKENSPLQPEVQTALNQIKDKGVLEGYVATKSAELEAISAEIAADGGGDPDALSQLEDKRSKVQRLLTNLEHRVANFNE